MIIRQLRWMLCCVVLSALLAGCQTVPEWFGQGGSEPGSAGLLPVDQELPGLVDYAEWLSQQRSPVLVATYRKVKQRVDQSRNPHDVLNLAMLLAVPDSGFQNDARALELYDEVLVGETEADLRNFIRLQQLSLRDRNNLSRSWQRQLDQQKQQVVILQQQLDQLKSIEKGLIERQGD